jgi:hypothetical protein
MLLLTLAVSSTVEITAAVGSSPRISGGTSGIARIERVSDLIGMNKLALVGRRIVMRDVPVERVAGDREFWAGRSRSDRVLVIVDAVSLNQAVASSHGLENGQAVDLMGTLERVPGMFGTVRVTSWGRLDQRDASALQRAEVYVYATRVQLVPTGLTVTRHAR